MTDLKRPSVVRGHSVNGITVQTKLVDPQSSKVLPSVDKTKKKIISTPPLMLSMYNIGQRGHHKCRGCHPSCGSACQREDPRLDHGTHARTRRSVNILTRDDVIVIPDNVGHLPTINAPATQTTTVNEVLNQSLIIMRSLQLTKIVCVFDQALYAKATEFTCKHPDKFKATIIIRLGRFHTICTLLVIVGKRFQDSGWRVLCIESGMIADSSISGVMDGLMYNQAVRLHKLVYEAVVRLVWKGFLSWLQANHTDDVVHVNETLKTIGNMSNDVSQTSLKQVLQNRSCARIM